MVEHALEDALFDEPIETVREHVASDPETLLELVEPRQPEEGVADDQPGPALTDDLERLCDRAGLLSVVIPPEHGHSVAGMSCVKLPIPVIVGFAKQPTGSVAGRKAIA